MTGPRNEPAGGPEQEPPGGPEHRPVEPSADGAEPAPGTGAGSVPVPVPGTGATASSAAGPPAGPPAEPVQPFEPGEGERSEPEPGPPAGDRTGRRTAAGAARAVRGRREKSPRTAPTAVVVVAALAVCGPLLYDVIAVRAGRRAAYWRTELADQLATHHLDDLWVLLGAGAAVLLGGWLLWLAFAPGLRRWLSLLPAATTDAMIDRAGVGALLVARADEVPGVERTTVRINRRRARVTIEGPADPAAVQRDLAAELDRIALARPLRLEVLTSRIGAGTPRTGGRTR
ncbi:hypothetical protein GCM10010495_25670 [Kitasatospora herbaricolor]|uniref:DUF6286 domain-containing protein n=1 Tax=Kitasatospora herbaricolor TaxID=68217 RepID=UPI00174A741F|nr:DUF6286 domain-containing protein [Kitasatospora herbaricolor]MDQ0311230.1 hypothetical protein [Kitasatospora herbaricolor]GGV11215.1 hypothetical protein GCM10010495_25670 [Kitasatospora herbaricolor]